MKCVAGTDLQKTDATIYALHTLEHGIVGNWQAIKMKVVFVFQHVLSVIFTEFIEKRAILQKRN